MFYSLDCVKNKKAKVTHSTVDYYVDGINLNWRYCSSITVHFSFDWLLFFVLFCPVLFGSHFLLCWISPAPCPLGDSRSMAVLSRSVVTLTCPSVLGDYVLLYWEYPDSKRMELIFQYDRWRRSYTNQTKLHLHLTGSTTLAVAGNFSFSLSPALKDGGIYLCEVFLDDMAFSQANKLSVLHGNIFILDFRMSTSSFWYLN